MQLDRLLPTIVAAASLVACGPGEPTVEPAAPTEASEPAKQEAEVEVAAEAEVEAEVEPEPEAEPEQPTTTPLSEDPDSCQVLLVIEAEGAKGQLGKPVTLQARAKNLTETPLELTLEDRCPGGPAFFAGLEPPDGSYDYYRTCNKGVCAERPPIVIALPPGELVDISSTQIDPAGKQPCNEPISPGRYELSFTLPLARGAKNPTTCGPEPLVLRRK
jgi:hypothetical protein